MTKLVWTELHLPVPTAPDAARHAMQALAGLPGHRRIVLEATGSDGQIQWRLAADHPTTGRVLEALAPHLPGLRGTDAVDRFQPRIAGKVRAPGHRTTPLETSRIEPVTRSVLGALARAKKSESVSLQLILGPSRGPKWPQPPLLTTANQSYAQNRLRQAKYSEYRFACTLRVAAKASDDTRARSLVGGVASALRGLEVPGVRLVLSKTSTDGFFRVQSPWLWTLELGVSELAAMAGWPLASRADIALPGVPPPHPAQLPAHPRIPSTGRILGTSLLEPDRTIAQHPTDSLRHLHIVGPPGTGKSTLLGNLALQDIKQGRGLLVVDPKGDLITDLLARIPEDRRDDVVVLDPNDIAPVGVDSFAGEPELAADNLLAVFHDLYSDSWGPRTHDILHACLLSLARRGNASLTMVPMLLTNAGFRRSIVGNVAKNDPMGLGSFWAWFNALSEAERAQVIAPLMNKLRPILMRPGLRAVFGQRSPRFAISDVITKRRILLVSLSKGTLGGEAAQLLGAIVIALFWQAALARVSVPESNRQPVMAIVDEVQDFLRLPGDLGDALAQARGLGVGFTLAHQHLAQLPTSIREAVLANARSRIAFQLSPRDASEFARTMGGDLTSDDFQTLPAFHAYARLLTDATTLPWCSITTLPMSPANGRESDIRELSRTNYGQPLDQVEAELLELLDFGSRKGGERLGRTPNPAQGEAS